MATLKWPPCGAGCSIGIIRPAALVLVRRGHYEALRCGILSRAIAGACVFRRHHERRDKRSRRVQLEMCSPPLRASDLLGCAKTLKHPPSSRALLAIARCPRRWFAMVAAHGSHGFLKRERIIKCSPQMTGAVGTMSVTLVPGSGRDLTACQ